MWLFWEAEVFWDDRVFGRRESMIDEKERREQRDNLKRDNFLHLNRVRLIDSDSVLIRKRHSDSGHLTFWCHESVWTYCSNCNSMSREKLLQRYRKRPKTRNAKTCVCLEDRYVVPLLSSIPESLRDLSLSEVCALRPFDLHCGDYRKHEHGYRQKNGMCRLSVSLSSVQEKICRLEDRAARKRCRKAYNYLIVSEESSYAKFVNKREQLIGEGKQLNMYNFAEMEGMECCLWPNLHLFTSLCETVLKGNESRLSRKVSFLIKTFSQVIDYSLQFELLQFQYDLWIFKTVSGALSSARKMNCSPARALNAKTFSTGYWKDQYRLLLDAVDQFGYPTVFVTISPYEWHFLFLVGWVKFAKKLVEVRVN